MLRDDEKFYLPNLHNFQNDNVFYGSFRGLRFRVKTVQTQEADKTVWGMETLCWYGDFCLEDSDVVASAQFPMSEEGYDQVLGWLEEQYRILLERQAAQPPSAPNEGETLGV